MLRTVIPKWLRRASMRLWITSIGTPGLATSDVSSVMHVTSNYQHHSTEMLQRISTSPHKSSRDSCLLQRKNNKGWLAHTVLHLLQNLYPMIPSYRVQGWNAKDHRVREGGGGRRWGKEKRDLRRCDWQKMALHIRRLGALSCLP